MFMVQLDADSYYSLLGVEPNATFAEIREARDRMVHELRERQHREPTNREELLERQKQVNMYGEVLARPARREEYDRENVHLRFLAIRPAAAPMFVDPADRLDALYRAVSDHLRRAGVEVPPLSDLDRADFSGDLTAHPLLDGWAQR